MWSCLIRRWLPILGWMWCFTVVNELQWMLDRMRVCICRHSDAQVSRVLERGWECEKYSTLEAARSLLFIEVGECRVVVRRTCDWQLRNRKKCNRRWDTRGNVGKETLPNVAGHLNYSPLLRAPPRGEGGVLRVISPNAAFVLDLSLGLSGLNPGLWPVQNIMSAYLKPSTINCCWGSGS